MSRTRTIRIARINYRSIISPNLFSGAGVLFLALEAVEKENAEQGDDYQTEVIYVIPGKKLTAAYPCHHGEIGCKH